MATDLTLSALAFLTLGVALWAGPVTLTVRGVLRAVAGPTAVRRYTPMMVPALAAGSLCAVALTGILFGGAAAVTAALLALLVAMVALDLTWRWLPMAWTLAALWLGLASAVVAGDPIWATFGALVGGGLLLALRLTFQLVRGVEGLGQGDIWLAAGLGAFIGPTLIGWLLCAAAALGLGLHALSASRRAPAVRTRYGVAFGAHLALLAPLFLTF